MKFRFSPDFVIDTDQEPYCREGLRIGMLGGPGSGKSWNDALLMEKFLSQGGTIVAFQPRDEYFTLKEKFDILSVGGVHAKDMEFALTSPLLYAKAVVEHGISMLIYTSDVEDEEKLVDWVSRFLQAIMRLQEVYHRPLMVVPEETQEYAPNSPKGHVAAPWVFNRMVKVLKDLSTQGRKLNIIPVFSSQRPQDVNFAIRQLANVTFYGKFSSHDVKYIDTEVLATVRKLGVDVHAEQLVKLGKAEWLVVYGSQSKRITVTEPRLTRHGADTPSLEYVAPRAGEAKKTVDELAKSITAALEKEHADESELEKTKRKLHDTEVKLKDAEAKANLKVSLQELLEGGKSRDPKAIEKELQDTYGRGRAEQKAEDDAKLQEVEDDVKEFYGGTIGKLESDLNKLSLENEKLKKSDAATRRCGSFSRQNSAAWSQRDSAREVAYAITYSVTYGREFTYW